MTYEIIQPPFTLKFRGMKKSELKNYFSWFISSMPDRIVVLERAVRATPSFEGWRADFTPESLDVLGNWFVAQIEQRDRTPEEVAEVKEKMTMKDLVIETKELTNRSFSLAMDIGMYLGQTMQRNHPTLQWQQTLANKKFVDYGQAILVEQGPVPMNPVGLLVGLAYRISRYQEEDAGMRLKKVYETWSKYPGLFNASALD